MAWMTSLGALLAMLPVDAGAAGPALTLGEAEAIAIENAFDVRSAQSGLDRAATLVRAAHGATGFHFTVGAQYMRFDQPQPMFAGGQFATIIDQRTANAALSLLVDISGVIRQGVAAAQDQKSAAESTLAAAKNTVRSDVRNAYFSVLSAGWGVTIRQEALATIRGRLDTARRRFEAGAVAQFDVLRLEAEVVRAEAELIDSRNALALAKAALNNTLGRPIETPFEAVEAVEVEEAIPDRPEGELVALAMATRPEIAAADAGLRALGRIKETERRGLLPSLALSAQYTRTIDALRGQRENQVVGLATLSFPVYDSGITRARVRAAQEDENQARIRLDQLRLGVALQVRQALLRLTNAREQLEVAGKLVELQTEALRLAQLRFDVGQGILLEVNQAQTDLTAARVSQSVARHQVLTAIAGLRLAVGTDDLASPAPNEPTLDEKAREK
jgi:outer membrane protein TolC